MKAKEHKQLAEHVISQTDRKIIASLARNGRRSFREIARELDISEGTVRQRVGRLVDLELIRITVVGNLITLGFEVVAMVHIRVQPGHARFDRRAADDLPSRPFCLHLIRLHRHRDPDPAP